MSEPEPISVISKDGIRGSLVEGMPSDAATSHVLVMFETGQRVLVPLDTLTLRADGRYYYLALRVDELEQRDNGQFEAVDQPHIVPVIEEVLDITRKQVEIGRVRVHKHVHERTEVVDEPLLHDEVTVTHVPINQVIEQPVSIRQEGETIIVPVLKEVLVVEKRLMLVEEVHITRRTSETHQPQEVTLRREEVEIKRIIPAENPNIGGTEPAA